MSRITSIDAYRGLVMFLMLAEVLNLPTVADRFPDCSVMRVVKFHTTHVEWVGGSLHDLIQPSFSFLVGVALVFSLANRRAKGQSLWVSGLHAVWRSQVLIWLGVFLRSINKPQTNFTFQDTLSQIGLGYVPLFLLALLRPRWWLAALGVILVGYWLLFALWPLPPEGYDPNTIRMKQDGPHLMTGFEAHWNKNVNPGYEVDQWFLNLFPPHTFRFNPGGYVTLNFVTTLATMILGLIAGHLLRAPGKAWTKVGWFAGIGAGMLVVGVALGELGVCPVVKRIWTPSWVLVSGGWCFLILAAFHALTDATGYGGWSYPLRVIGANSIFIYAVHKHFGEFIQGSLVTHFGPAVFTLGGLVDKDFMEVVRGAMTLSVFWLLLWWMYARKVFVRV